MKVSIVLVGVAALCGLLPRRISAQVQVIDSEPADSTLPNYIHGFELYGSGLFWISGGGGTGCRPEFPTLDHIGLEGYAGTPARYVVKDCAVDAAGVVRDDAFVYYTDNNSRRLYKKALAAQPTDPPVEIPTPFTPLAAGATFGAMMMWNGRLYWTDNNTNEFRVNSINPDGSAPTNELTAGYAETPTYPTGNHVRNSWGLSYTRLLLHHVDALFILTDDGALFRQDVNPPAYDLVTVDSGVQDFALRDEEIQTGTSFDYHTALYAAKGTFVPCVGSGSLVELDAGHGGRR